MIVRTLTDPFPHVIATDFFEPQELNLIWEELNFFTKPNKLYDARLFGGAQSRTNSNAVILDEAFNDPGHSNILSLLRSDDSVTSRIKHLIKQLNDSDYTCNYFHRANKIVTKLRYYHDGSEYGKHTDFKCAFLAFMDFFKEPKHFSGGELFFDDGYKYDCENNSIILIPSYIPHGVTEVSIDDNNFFGGFGRYCVSMFFDYIRNSS